MAVLGQIWLYSGKSACIRATVSVFDQNGCIRESGFNWAKWLYSVKIGVIRASWLYSGKSYCTREMWLYSDKVVVFGQKWLH